MAKVKISSNHLSGLGTVVEIDGVKLNKVTKAELSFRVHEPVKFAVEVLADETAEEFEADTHLTIRHALTELSERRLRAALGAHFDQQLGHGSQLVSADDVIALITERVGKLKP
jgi:hypothetical protein